MAKKKPTKKWLLSSSAKPVGRLLDAATKAEIEVKVQELIDKELKPKHIKPPLKDSTSNYLIDITMKWHGTTLFLLSVYACPRPNAIAPTFEDRFARLRPAADGKFDLSFMRYTGQWVELFQGQSLDDCLREIKDDPWFMP